MWDPMWMLASFHSTSFPFIQILPVPGKAIALLLVEDLIRAGRDARMSALQFAAKRAFRGPRLQRLAAMPAERRLGCLAGAQARLDFGGVDLRLRGSRDGAPRYRRARKDIRQQV